MPDEVVDDAAAYPWALRIERFEEDEWLPPKREWKPGVWITEPDLVEWRSSKAPYPMLILRGGMGALCGYVGVPPAHPYHGQSPWLVNWSGPSCSRRRATGEPPHFWWLGFDCGHSNEYAPLMDAQSVYFERLCGVSTPRWPGTEYVDIDGCCQRTQDLAIVLWAIEKDKTGRLAEGFKSLEAQLKMLSDKSLEKTLLDL